MKKIRSLQIFLLVLSLTTHSFSQSEDLPDDGSNDVVNPAYGAYDYFEEVKPERWVKSQASGARYGWAMTTGALIGLGIGNFILDKALAGAGFLFVDLASAGILTGGFILRDKGTLKNRVRPVLEKTITWGMISIGAFLLFISRIGQLSSISREYVNIPKQKRLESYVSSRQKNEGRWGLLSYEKAF